MSLLGKRRCQIEFMGYWETQIKKNVRKYWSIYVYRSQSFRDSPMMVGGAQLDSKCSQDVE